MTYRGGVLTGVVVTLLAAGAAGAGWWLVNAKPGQAGKPAPPPVPATVPKPFKEDGPSVTLTPEGEARLGLKTGTVERKPVRRVRTYGGEVTVPPGRAVIVSAPLAGSLKPVGDAPLAAGTAVKKGQPVVQLLPLLDPVGRANLVASRVDAEGQVQTAAENLKAAEVALERAKKVLAGGAGSQRMVDEAQAMVDVAKKGLAAATARRDLLAKVVGDLDAGTTTPIPVESPETGVLRAVSALPGQNVPAGAALFEVVNLDQVWVRVAVYVGDRPEIDPGAAAAVGGLVARPGTTTHPAKPVAAPPAANPATGTVDLFYALDNTATKYAPGQRVGVVIPLADAAESLTVPWDAVVFDINGGAWVYEPTGERAFTRRRVVVRYASGNTAVLESGPPPGTKVVTAGAAELFGTEAGFSK